MLGDGSLFTFRSDIVYLWPCCCCNWSVDLDVCYFVKAERWDTHTSGITRVSWYQKGKTKNQETVSGSDIGWAMCKSAPHSRQITMPAPHHSSFFYAGLRMPFLVPTNIVKALKAKWEIDLKPAQATWSFLIKLHLFTSTLSLVLILPTQGEWTHSVNLCGRFSTNRFLFNRPSFLDFRAIDATHKSTCPIVHAYVNSFIAFNKFVYNWRRCIRVSSL